jgi:hypothetical protein
MVAVVLVAVAFCFVDPGVVVRADDHRLKVWAEVLTDVTYEGDGMPGPVTSLPASVLRIDGSVTTSLPEVVETPVSVRVTSTTPASVIGAELLLVPRPSESRPHPSVAEFGSATFAVTVPGVAVVTVRLTTGSTVGPTRPVIETGTALEGVSDIVVGLEGSSARQSPYQAAYEPVKGKR